jgi:hypothetical protein
MRTGNEKETDMNAHPDIVDDLTRLEEINHDLLVVLKDIVCWGYPSVMPDSGGPWSVPYEKIQKARDVIYRAEWKE